jgi:HSP20 family protein
MTEIIRRSPREASLPALSGMRQIMDRLFDDSLFTPFWQADPSWQPEEGSLALDVSEGDGQVVVRASLPGFQKEDVEVQLHEGVLSIKATHAEETETKEERFYRRERRTGSVSRRIALPGVVSDADVSGALEDGVLTLRIPLPEKPKPRQIEIS